MRVMETANMILWGFLADYQMFQPSTCTHNSLILMRNYLLTEFHCTLLCAALFMNNNELVGIC